MDKLSCVSTVVGSFPYENTPANMEQAFWDQIQSGVNYPCYPQLESMISQFLDPLSTMDCNLRKTGELYALDGEFKVPSKPFALNYGEFVVNFLKAHPDVKSKIKGWKACLTGPFTLAGSILIKPEVVGNKPPIVFQEARAMMDPNTVMKLAEMMAMIAKQYDEMGATIISMDEPSLTLIVGRKKILFHSEDFIISALNKAVSTISHASSVHICGPISPKLRDILLSSNVKIMDHEFANGSNEGIFDATQFDNANKTLAYGVLESSVKYKENAQITDYVETAEIVSQRIQKAIQQVGKQNLIFKPDCGFGGLRATFGQEMGSEIVRRKLSMLRDVMNKL